MLTDTFQRLPLSSIAVDRAARQRRQVSTDGLRDSIARNGVINPIVVTREGVLVAGERRLQSCVELGLPDIPVRFVDEVAPEELRILELEENAKRSDLSWQDEVRARLAIHEAYVALDPTWSQRQTGEILCIATGHMAKSILVAKRLDDPRVSGCQTMVSALNVILRLSDRAASDALSDIFEAGDLAFPELDPLATVQPALDFEGLGLLGPAVEGGPAARGLSGAVSGPPAGPSGAGSAAAAGALGPAQPQPAGGPPSAGALTPLAPPPPAEAILHTTFESWLTTYSGPKFNFIHCDFPYGIGTFAGAGQGQRDDSDTTYDDSADTYWQLVETFCRNRDVFMSHSAHLMFWLSAQVPIIHRTLSLFQKLAPDLVFNPIPLVWAKSDSAGIIRDFRRKPKPTYEVCLFAAREDRFILKAVNNSYSAPTGNSGQPTEKPEPMLRHFFEMVVDSQTRMFDPTCGCGSSLRAAESLNARAVLGIERDQTNAERAISLLRLFRAKRGAGR